MKMPARLAQIACLVALTLAFAPAARAAETTAPPPDTAYDQKMDIVYDDDVDGVALVMDIFTPKSGANGAAVINVVSGAWYSDRGKIRDLKMAGFFEEFCSRGFTVFAIRPGSVTLFTGSQMIDHLKRGVRWVRMHADEYKIDPNRMGISGGSAGGHLASLLAVTADDGNPNAKDPLDRQSCRVKAAGVFFPPTDFITWSKKNPIARAAVGGLFYAPEKAGKLSPEEVNAAMEAISPALHVTSAAPPFLIYHGTADPLVPMEQSEILLKALQANNVEAKLVIKEGGAHPWPTIREEVAVMGDWFKEKLAK